MDKQDRTRGRIQAVQIPADAKAHRFDLKGTLHYTAEGKEHVHHMELPSVMAAVIGGVGFDFGPDGETHPTIASVAGQIGAMTSCLAACIDSVEQVVPGATRDALKLLVEQKPVEAIPVIVRVLEEFGEDPS